MRNFGNEKIKECDLVYFLKGVGGGLCSAVNAGVSTAYILQNMFPDGNSENLVHEHAPYVLGALAATNIASGAYELIRYNYNKVKREKTENRIYFAERALDREMDFSERLDNIVEPYLEKGVLYPDIDNAKQKAREKSRIKAVKLLYKKFRGAPKKLDDVCKIFLETGLAIDRDDALGLIGKIKNKSNCIYTDSYSNQLHKVYLKEHSTYDGERAYSFDYRLTYDDV